MTTLIGPYILATSDMSSGPVFGEPGHHAFDPFAGNRLRVLRRALSEMTLQDLLEPSAFEWQHHPAAFLEMNSLIRRQIRKVDHVGAGVLLVRVGWAKRIGVQLEHGRALR